MAEEMFGWQMIRNASSNFSFKPVYLDKDLIPAARKLKDYEDARDLEHSLVLSLLNDGNFACASQMYDQLQTVYRPSNPLEDENFSQQRRISLIDALERNKTISSLEITGEGCEYIAELLIVNSVMRDIPNFQFAGRHEVLYGLNAQKELSLIDY